MATRWPPTKDSELVNYLNQFSAKVTAAPIPLGLTAPDATALASATTAFVNAYDLAVDPATRTKSTVADKDVKKGLALVLLRSDAKRIQANPAVTAAMKADLGLPVHDAVPTRLTPPTTKPVLTLVSIGQRSQTVKIADETTPDKKARPFGTSGVELFAFTGTGTPPSDLRQWTFIGLSTKPTYDVTWDSADDGKQVRLAARWFNDKGETGPLSFPITAPIAA